MRFFYLIAALYVALIFTVSPAAAQLSQLEFDESLRSAAKKTKKESKEESRARLKDSKLEAKSRVQKADEGPDAQKQSKEKASSKNATIDLIDFAEAAEAKILAPESKTSVEEEKESEPRVRVPTGGNGVKIPLPLEGEDNGGYALLPPSVKTPLVDEDDKSALTSISWTKGAQQECWEVQAENKLRSKAKAVQDVLRRYSGADDYYEALNSTFCQPECKNKSGTSVVTGLSIVDGFGGEFKIENKGNSCSYVLRKPMNKRWPIYRIDKIVCHCLN